MEDTPAKKKAKLESTIDQQHLINKNEFINKNTFCQIFPTTTSGDSTNFFVDDIAQLLLVKNFVIVQGPSGSGKTHSAKIVSEKCGLRLNILQISHQVDIKLLYGSYTCTEVPGEFVWKPSKFSQYLQQESLILLENIDHGGSDLASAIFQLVENGCVELPNGMKIKMNKKCRILGSIEENAQQMFSIPLMLQEYPYQVRLSAPSFNQLNDIIKQKYPKLESIREKLISLFFAASDLIKTKKVSIDRLLNTRDLFKAFSRLNSSPPSILIDPRAIFLELFDVWIVHLTSISLKLELANCISEALSLAKEEQNFLLNVRHPKVNVENEKVEIGRITLERRLLTDINSQSPNFVLTRDATCLLERLAASIIQRPPEPILLTGETGVGKTSSIQSLANLLRVPLHVVNLSQESESTDLLGGYKPASPLNILRPLADEYFRLFKASFDLEKNFKFLNNVNKCFNSQRFGDFLQLIVKSSTRICRRLPDANKEWMELANKASRMFKYFADEDDIESWRRRMFFAYVKGVATEALEQGHWLLVDEINLASAECLDVIVELLELSTDFHQNFRLFACMNHATDVGKRLLPSGIRAKFTELFVSEIVDMEQLHVLVRGHLPSLPKNLVDGTLNFYKEICSSFPLKFSLRSLSRALSMAGDNYFNEGQLTSILRACHLSFSSQLGVKQREKMCQILANSFGLSTLQFPMPKASHINDSEFVLIEGFPIPRGSEIITNDGNYVFTPSVRENIKLLASVVSTRRYPILLEGETSAGKTSMVIQLAKMSGNCVYRINNHEHSDIQEYIGSYAPDIDGRLVFSEGLLLKALKFGHWIILDELNLAPSAVLEALNRLLDDNRELFVAELNCTIKAHTSFQLFATQNPFGVYSGRKHLSRAFLNRFMVIQCDTIPLPELPLIVQQRCGIAPKQAKLAVDVLYELRNRRAISKIFSSSDGLMTLRDLFRWANRLAIQEHADDWRQSMADHGYFVLATRCRTTQDEREVVHVLEQKLQREINLNRLFGESSPFMPLNVAIPQQIILTEQFRRTLILCSEAWKCDEPVLLVGDTGCGKTSAVHLFGDLLSINCHERTDASDLLGSVRPFSASIGGPTFRWQDGVVVQAMRRGQRLLIDEISLASDSVLERLNPLLESERTILLTNPAASASRDSTSIGQLIRANSGFQLVATMNPGNDHGKRELSKALRNRFTEIWCPCKYNREDALEILRRRLHCCDTSAILTSDLIYRIAMVFIEFTEFFAIQLAEIIKFSPSLRDLVGLAELFMEMLNTSASHDHFSFNIPFELLYHSIEATFLDALGVLPQRMHFNRNSVIEQCRSQFLTIMQKCVFICENVPPLLGHEDLIINDHGLSIGPFSIKCSDESIEPCKFPKGYSINSPSTRKNLLRIARALASNKPIMLEGSPGSGKSSLVMALAAATGHKLIRLNLSEQTDIYDLFGTDVPVAQSDGKTATFAWRDGPVLKAIKEGSWVLLDEMNLASQSVLEGLNSCFDFRKNIYISELDHTFDVDARNCRFFACQNPHSQGGDRRALPKSFVNRFISIFIEEMTDDDFIFILTEYSKTIPDGNSYLSDELIAQIVLINKLFQETDTCIAVKSSIEFNLRDLFRFLEAIVFFHGNIGFSFDLVYLSRLSSKEAKQQVINTIYNRVFSPLKWMPSVPLPKIDPNSSTFSIGNVTLNYAGNETEEDVKNDNDHLCLLATQMELLEKVAACVQLNWLLLLVGPSYCGKRSLIKSLAKLNAKQLHTMRLNSGTDALDLLGSFEQIQVESSPPDLHTDENLPLDEFTLSEDDRGGLCFKWVESIFLRAFRDGHWLLVEDVNCCNSAVLDCLNSCLESKNGELLLPMDDSQVIHRHPDFRIFFSMNPRNGQISRAMRNRTLEIQFCVDKLAYLEEFWSKNVYDALSIIFHPCIEFKDNLLNSTLIKEEVMINDLPPEQLLKCAALFYAKLKLNSSIDFKDILRLFLDMLKKQDNDVLLSSELPISCYFPLLRPSLKNDLFINIFNYYCRCWVTIYNKSFHLNIPIELFIQMAFVFPYELVLDCNPFVLDCFTNTFNSPGFHMPITKIYEQMKNFISRILCENDRAVNLDEIIFSIFEKFRLHYSLWNQLQSNITNSSYLGEQYLLSLCASSCLCMPFTTYDHLSLCSERWKYEENMLVDNDQNMEESNSIFAPLKQHLLLLLNKIGHLFCSNSTSTSLLDWINTVGAERLFLFSRFMSSSNLTQEIDFNEQPQSLFSYLNKGTFITHSANSLLWSRLNYNDNLLQHVRVCEMSDALIQLERTSELFWDIVFASKFLNKTNNILLSECEKHFSVASDRSIKQNFSIESILFKINSLTPPKGFLDHIFFIDKYKNYLQIKNQHIEHYFYALKDFLQLTISKDYDIDQVCTIASNHSKFFAAFSDERQTTISKLNILEEDLYFWTKNQSVYRVEMIAVEELVYKENFQKNIVEELIYCTSALNELFTQHFLEDLLKLQVQPNALERLCSLLLNALQTVQVLRKRLCSLLCSNLPTILLFPDMIIPYLFALNCLVIFLSEQHKRAKENLSNVRCSQKDKISNVIMRSLEEIPNEETNSEILLHLLSDEVNFSPRQKLPILLWYINCSKINFKSPLSAKCHTRFLQWLFKHWEQWHDKYAKAKKDQLYVVRKRKLSKDANALDDDIDERTNSNNEFEVEEEFNNFLPDFSESPENETVEAPKSEDTTNSSSLDGDDIYPALQAILSSSEHLKLPFLNFMSLSGHHQNLFHCNSSSSTHEIFAFHHLFQINDLFQQLERQSSEGQRRMNQTTCLPLNVYKECEPAVLVQCCELLEPLRKSASRLLNEFPENVQLVQLLSSLDTFNNAQAGVPLMKHAAQLERILEHAETWESISDRAHSIREQMFPLQELLVDWRRREVQCWNELISYVKHDSSQLAVLVSWPLFKCALELEGDGNKLLLMLIEWLQNSTLGDFETRIWTGRLLSLCLSLLEQENEGIRRQKTRLSCCISCVVDHFEQFNDQVKERYTQLYNPIETELRNFTRVVRYNDLNLWSVRESAKRAHVQLFRILRKFKEMSNESLSPILHDKVPKMPSQATEPFPNSVPSLIVRQLSNASTLSHMLNNFDIRFDKQLQKLVLFDELYDIKGSAVDFLQLVLNNVSYKSIDKTNESTNNSDLIDSANEKLHGRALFERQQRFSLLIRSLNRIGLSSRRAHKLDSEKLTVETLKQVSPDIKNLLISGDMIYLLFRHTIASRNVFMRKFASWRRCSQDTPHLAEQLSPSILDNLRGTTEFGLYWIFRALNGLATIGVLEVKRLHLVSKCFETELENLMRPEDNFSSFTHQQLTTKFAQNCDCIKTIHQIVDRMSKLLSCCPKEHYKQTSQNLESLQEPLGILRQSDLQFSQLKKDVDDLLGIITKIFNLNKKENEKVLRLPAIFEAEYNILKEKDIWNKTRWSTYSQNFCSLLEDLKTIVITSKHIQHYFPEDSNRICEFINKTLFNYSENEIIQSSQHLINDENSFDEIQQILLFPFQNIFNQMEHMLNSDMNRLDAIKSLIECFGQYGFKASDQLIKNFHNVSLLSSIQPTSSVDLLNRFSTLSTGVYKLYERLLHYLCEFIFQLITLHEHWVAIGCHLLTNGFVNPIPKSGLSLQGDDKKVENMCGFGDGDLTNDARDVGGELEAMEQIEGLKNGTENDLDGNQNMDQSNENPEQQKLPEVDNPIDVDDDFAGCIEGLDAQDGENEENGDDDNFEEEDPNADWNFGEVDEPEDRQLDPRLWEQNENDETEQEMEEEDGNGADSLTEDLVAAQQQKQKKNDENQEKGENSTDAYQDGEENADDYGSTELDEKGECKDENENKNADDLEQSTDTDLGVDQQENGETEERDEFDESNCDRHLSEDEDNQQKQNEEQEEKGVGNSSEIEKETDENLPSEYQNNETLNNEFDQDAIGDTEGAPNAVLPPEAMNKEQIEKNDNGTEGEVGENSNNEDPGDEQNHRDSAARNSKKSAQLDVNSKEREELDDNQDKSNGCNEEGGGNDIDEEMEEIDGTEREKLSVIGTSTFEQANRTRALFDTSLRRLRKEVETNELAENAFDQRNSDKEKQNEAEVEEVEMDNESNTSIEIIDGSITKDKCNVFLNIAERQNFDFGITSNDLSTVDRLCKEFDRLERETASTSDDEDIRQLQLKWALISEGVTSLASELAESLRSIIAPTIANKLQGDYRTGKRLNMRRLIAYIASDYRKDQIWMRRTKCAKRNYQVCIAVDNSQSMKHNHFTEITCNALCLIERALRQLEIGQLAICSFGSNIQMLSDFSSSEDPSIGLHILQTFKFNQQKTDISQLLESSIALFKNGREFSLQIPEQMLIILGDGRDVLANGIADIKKHLEHLEHDRVTVLFLIMDTAEQSITEVRVADFVDGGCSFKPYMECFPFPLYALVRSATSLPSTISEAVRQWFEFTRNE